MNALSKIQLNYPNLTFGSEGLMTAEITSYSGIAPTQEICQGLGTLSHSVIQQNVSL